MANEITFSASLNLTRTNEELANWVTGALNFNQTGSRAVRGVQTATTTSSPVQIGSIGTLGFCMVKNLDTNTLNEIYMLSTQTGVKFLRLSAGEVSVFKIGGDITAPYLQALTTACPVEIQFFEL